MCSWSLLAKTWLPLSSLANSSLHSCSSGIGWHLLFEFESLGFSEPSSQRCLFLSLNSIGWLSYGQGDLWLWDLQASCWLPYTWRSASSETWFLKPFLWQCSASTKYTAPHNSQWESLIMLTSPLPQAGICQRMHRLYCKKRWKELTASCYEYNKNTVFSQNC